MNNAVIKGCGYTLVHAPDMVIHYGTTQTSERFTNPDSDYLKNITSSLRTYEQALSYMPNQTYIGAMTPEELAKQEAPLYDKQMPGADRFAKFGEIMPQDEFILLMQVCDVFDLIKLESSFVAATKPKIEKHPLIKSDITSKIKDGVEVEEIKRFINEEHAEAIYHDQKLVGCCKRAHNIDVNLSSHTLLENLVSKASCVLTVLHLMNASGMAKESVDYVIECSEEACGDMNQRGGGNFAKAVAEIAGLVNASGADCRGFCAAPTHALIQAASLVKAGTFENIVVCAGGSTAKLGMNGKDHIKKGVPVLEDVVGGFAVLVSKNDGVNPEINLDIIGKHSVGTGSSPQAVIASLTSDALTKAGLKITSIDKYSVEMQNPDVTKPAGAGDVPLANYKMIAALAVKLGEIPKTDLQAFIDKHGMTGWAPTQGHIPSGVPYIGFAREAILNKEINKAMIIGKGSLFLGRMTNLFDGVSFIIQPNSGKSDESNVSEDVIKKHIAEAMRSFAENLLKSSDSKEE